ncbi:non-specific lipid-transfer protein 1-like [Coffea eugenioides]|uniref:non-specific lipid-transfer protein 1-like n=1 Tax=Coffea eugenioides TaxID=49369 RepID=UPI000F60CACC|nr:non-specific lipid-transfer protein 1-like [Coffea eugenioides]
MLLGGLNSKVVGAVIMLTVVAGELAPRADAVIPCPRVIRSLVPCTRYLKNGGSVPGPCCAGVKGLVAWAKTVADRRSVCSCLKGAYPGYHGIKLPNAQSLPMKCGAKVHYKITPTIDCSRVT